MFRTLLELEGFEVAVAANGAEALARALQMEPDLVLCDLMMPVMDAAFLPKPVDLDVLVRTGRRLLAPAGPSVPVTRARVRGRAAHG